jgi:hypothetical protein
LPGFSRPCPANPACVGQSESAADGASRFPDLGVDRRQFVNGLASAISQFFDRVFVDLVADGVPCRREPSVARRCNPISGRVVVVAIERSADDAESRHVDFSCESANF